MSMGSGTAGNRPAPAVWFPAIRAGSGADVYTLRLVEGLNRIGVRAEIHWLPHRAEYAPFSVRVRAAPSWANIIHVNSCTPKRFLPSGMPLVVTVHHVVHDPAYARYKTRLQDFYHRVWIRRVEGRNVRNADHVVAVSRFTSRQTFACFRPGPVSVIPNWVDPLTYRPASRDVTHRPFRLLFVGNPSRRKGADLLPAIMRRLGDAFELRCTAGLKRRAAGAEWPANMKLAGGIATDAEMVRCYQGSDALLFPSRLEGFGLAAVEAQACGVPVIATRGSAFPEVVQDGVTGFLCPQDDVDEFVGACRRLSSDPALWRRMSAAARERAVTLFAPGTNLPRYVACYERVLREERGGEHPRCL
jgi:glycosyltransferase involved in cell wall biosynthesis